jgi:hypothetical protein
VVVVPYWVAMVVSSELDCRGWCELVPCSDASMCGSVTVEVTCDLLYASLCII